MKPWILAAITTFLSSGCIRTPKGITPVTGFELTQYLGTWYEIARLDHGFERGLNHVSAEYALREDGGMRVLNRGLGPEGWKTAEGRAYFVGDPQTGHLKVSFFGPFYGSYLIFQLNDYQTAYVTSNNRDYLWLLSRTPTLPQSEINDFIRAAKSLNFDTDALIFPAQK
jgi:apolipoprotein D and lipocalin family protein